MGQFQKLMEYMGTYTYNIQKFDSLGGSFFPLLKINYKRSL